MNKMMVIGNLGQDPDIRYSKDGLAICNFSLAVNEKKKGETKTRWFKITAFGKLAETCGKYLLKGKQVFVEGSLDTEEWKDKNTNENKYKLVIIASGVHFLGGNKENNESGENISEKKQPDQKSENKSQGSSTVNPSSDDIPF